MQQSNTLDKTLRVMIVALLALLAMMIFGFLMLFLRLPAGVSFANWLDSIFAFSGANATWYVTRAAGIIAYLLVWLSTVWGIGVASKSFDAILHRTFTYDLHEFLSLLGIGFILLHIVVLLGDKYMPFSLLEILLPFVSGYRPLWVGIGIIAFDLTLLVTVTFYLRRWIGLKTFRVVHVASYLGFFGTALHGLLSGTDSPLVVMQLIYGGTTLVVIFQTLYWVIRVVLERSERRHIHNVAEHSN